MSQVFMHHLLLRTELMSHFMDKTKYCTGSRTSRGRFFINADFV